MNENFIRFKWETDNEYNYRYLIHNMSGMLHGLISKFGEVIKKTPDYKDMLKKIEYIYKTLFEFDVPDCYTKSDRYLREGIEYYIKATKIMADEIEKELKNRNASEINKAGKFIETGTAFIKITACKNFEIFEIQQREWNDKNERSI